MEKKLKKLAKLDSLVVDESTFRQLVGSLIYLTATRRDISYTVSYISHFMLAPKAEHWPASKHVLRYVKGTANFDVLYNRSKDPRFAGYTDLNWAGCVDDKKCTSGYVFSLGTCAAT